MNVAKISEIVKNRIEGTEYVSGMQFNPVENNGYWIVSLVEAQYLPVEDIEEVVEFIEPEVDEVI